MRSAVVSSSTPGVLVTRMPRFVQAAMSTLFVPTAMLETTFRPGAAASTVSSMRSMTVASTPCLSGEAPGQFLGRPGPVVVVVLDLEARAQRLEHLREDRARDEYLHLYSVCGSQRPISGKT